MKRLESPPFLIAGIALWAVPCFPVMRSQTVVSEPFGSSDPNTSVTGNDQERGAARRWDCEKIPGRASDSESRGRPIWCSTRP